MIADPLTTFTPEPTVSASLPPPPVFLATQDPEDEQAREDAFSRDYFWNGKELHPFSLERFNIFVAQRAALGSPSLGVALADGSAFFPDAIRLLWLCSHESEAIQRLRSHPHLMQSAIEAWAEQHAPLHRADEILDVSISLFNSAYENKHETRPSRRGTSASGN